MPRLIDLTATLDPANRAKLPPPLAGAAKVVAPAIEYLHPADKGRDAFCAYLGCTHDDLPDGEGWGEEVLTDMSSHCGTRSACASTSGKRVWKAVVKRWPWRRHQRRAAPPSGPSVAMWIASARASCSACATPAYGRQASSISR